MKKILIPIAQGFEEIELVSIVDILRRAGIETILASVFVDSLLQEGAHKIIIKADESLEDIETSYFDGIVLAGGMQGVMNMRASEVLLSILRNFHKDQKLIAAICAAPLILDDLSLLSDDFCCYPGCEAMMKNTQAKRLELPCHTSDSMITGTGPAFALDFAIEILRVMLGEEAKEKIQDELLLNIRRI